MQYYFRPYLALIIVSATMTLHANSVDELMHDFSNKNALSQSTIDKNKGHLLLYTRDRLERMHANTLKDVLKTLPILSYNENRYGIADPLTPGGTSPYSSNAIRLYIDDVEVTQGWMGSGLVQYGDVNIDFVDHIEIYAIPPSFASSVEPAYMTIFMYSKIPERDSGSKVSLAQGSRSSNTQSISNINKEDGTSYMVNLSHTKENREKVPNGTDTPLSRDFERVQVFSYIKNENQMFHFQLIHKKLDTLAGLSYDATPLISQMDNLNIHLDYTIHLSELWKAQIAYSYFKTDLSQEDNIPLFISSKLFNKALNVEAKNSTYSAELSYKNVIGKHHVVFGTKARVKKLDSLYSKEHGALPKTFNQESIISAFIQDQYELSDNELITLGLKYSKVMHNAAFDDDNLMQLRLGYLYNDDTWNYKTYLFKNMFTIDPISRYITPDPREDIEPQVTLGFTQELAYHNNKNDISIMTFFIKEKNNLIEVNQRDDTMSFISVLKYDYSLDVNSKFSIHLGHARYFDMKDIGDIDRYTGYAMMSNAYDSFSIYNSIVWNYDSYHEKNHYDLTSSISWDIAQNFTFTLKGENLLNKAQTYDIFRINPGDGTFMSPLTVSPIDQKVSIEVEYRF